jgi:drug/metabolite transporter (DMT)-like permease
MARRRSVFAVLAIVQLFFATLGERPSARPIPSAVLIAAGVAVTIHEQRAREAGPSPADQSMVEV